MDNIAVTFGILFVMMVMAIYPSLILLALGLIFLVIFPPLSCLLFFMWIVTVFSRPDDENTYMRTMGERSKNWD